MSGGISRATVYKHWEEHEISTGRRSKEVDFDPATNNGAGTFTIDHRGQHERDWLLNEEGHLRQFEDHISNNLAKISVDYMATWVNDTLLSDLPVEVSDRHGLYRPIRRKTVHDWMGRAGAKNEVHQKSYYNDEHEGPLVLVDRQVSVYFFMPFQKCKRPFVKITPPPFLLCPFRNVSTT